MSKIVKTIKLDSDTNTTSRYKRSLRLLNDNDEEYIETYDPKEIPEKSTDTFHIVSQDEINRLDLISFNYYNNPLYWWVIAEASNISDPFDVPAGTVLRIPDFNTLYGLGGILL